MRHNILLAIAGAGATALLLTACGSTNAETTEPDTTSSSSTATVAAPAALHEAGTLSVCIDPEYAPMEYYENGTEGEIKGFDADGSRALAKYWGVDVDLQATAFDGLLPAMNANRCDIVWSGLYLSDKRLEVADGVTYMLTGPGLIVAKGNPKGITDAMSLCGLTIAAQSGSANEGILAEQSKACTTAGKPEITVQSYPKTAETVAAVSNGKADGLIETDVAVPDMVAKSGGKLEEVRGAFEASTKFAIYVNKGSALLPDLQSAVSALIADGTLAQVAETYGLDPAKVSQ